MRLLITSVVRGARPDEPSGFVHMIDYTGRRALAACPIPPPQLVAEDPNPRGGMRGGKGIAVTDSLIMVANSSAIHVYDHAWRPLRTISHPSCAGIHDIRVRGEQLWVTSARNDLLFTFDLQGTPTAVFNYRANAALLEALDHDVPNLLEHDELLAGSIDFRDPRTHRIEDHDRGHVNSLCLLPGGDILLSLGQLMPRSLETLWRVKGVLQNAGVWPVLVRGKSAVQKLLGADATGAPTSLVSPALARSAVVRIAPDGAVSPSLRLSGTSVPNHSLVALPDGSALYADTNHGDVLRFEPVSGLVTRQIHVADDFLRGLALVSPGAAIAGSQHTLYDVNLATGNVVRALQISDDPRVSVYDIHPVPDSVALLPARLPLAGVPA